MPGDRSRRSSSVSASRSASSIATSPAGPSALRQAPDWPTAFPSPSRSSGSTSACTMSTCSAQQVMSTDQRRLQVDAFARYRIVDPLLMYIRAGNERATHGAVEADPRAQKFATSSGRIEFASLLSPERQGIMDSVRKSLNRIARRIRRRGDWTCASSAPIFPTARRWTPPSTECAPRASRRPARYSRRAASRRRSSARRRTPTRRKIYAASFGKDPEFYDFYRAMQSYQLTFVGDGQDKVAQTTIILSPQNDYLKEFSGHAALNFRAFKGHSSPTRRLAPCVLSQLMEYR